MKITWFGHSCFMLESEHGTLVFDPWEKDYVPGYKNIPDNLTADEVICSHDHNDHNASQLIEISEKKHSYDIIKIPAFHDEENGALRGNNTITLVKFDNLKIVHFGDIGCPLTNEQKEMLMDSDIVMIPVGGYYTIDAKTAYEMTKSINAKVVIPMHYRGNNFGFDVISDVESFTSLTDNTRYLSSNTVTINKEDIIPSTIVFKPL